MVRRLGIGGISWEQEGERILVDIFSQFIQDPFEVGSDIDSSFFEGTQDRHQNAPRMGASVRLGAKAHLAGNDGGSEVSFGQVVFCRYVSVFGPVVEAGFILPEDILNAPDAQMLGRAFCGRPDLRLNLGRFP